MNYTKINLKQRINSALINVKLKEAVTRATSTTISKRKKIVDGEHNWEELRNYASDVKTHVIENLSFYLGKVEKILFNNGVKVLWAKNAAEANHLVDSILKEHNCKNVVKSKSMVTEEIHLNEYLEKLGYEVTETDLGEYIVQIANEKPSHITAPALHKTRAEIGKLFERVHGIEYTDNPEQLTSFARNFLREKFLSADAGITGANFIVAENGTIVLVENEGNISFYITAPKVQIVIAGIEKIIPKFQDVQIFLRLLAPSATGQKIPTYVSFLTPNQIHLEEDNSLYVIFLDNGRTNLLSNKDFRQTLKCIRCGACLNVCPIYNRIGGHTYDFTYSGPIGSVIAPILTSCEQVSDLSYASSLCGACSEICPVKIDLAHLLIKNRFRYVSHKKNSLEKLFFNIFAFICARPRIYDISLKSIKMFYPLLKHTALLRAWKTVRELPEFSKKSFKELYLENKR
ncbi:MAG: LutB/LldF family L-lactate oxidation iron-sulfur protein [Ignavibacteria bacterium]|nr:LutB/LldF family L-lactate oxidation iron-sulfur protein [Ignavibacteria bacterium]